MDPAHLELLIQINTAALASAVVIGLRLIWQVSQSSLKVETMWEHFKRSKGGESSGA